MSGTLIYEYLRALHARRAPITTQRSVRSVLTIVERYTGKALEHATLADLERWQHRRADEVGTRTLRTQVGSVRAFYSWAAKTGRIRENPAAGLDAPRVGLTLPRPMPEQRLATAYYGADPRLRAMVSLAAFAGLRCCEIAALSWSDVYLDVDEPYLHVRGKGSHERVISASPQLVEVLLALPLRRGPVIRRGDGQAGHNTSNAVSKVGNRYLHSLGIPDTMHSLRHRFLTEMCREAGLRVAQEAAGHASGATTSIYTKVLQSDIRPAVVAVGRLLLPGPAAVAS